MLHFGHDFDWKNVEILDVERNFSKCLISEMINIKCVTRTGLIYKQTLKP